MSAEVFRDILYYQLHNELNNENRFTTIEQENSAFEKVIMKANEDDAMLADVDVERFIVVSKKFASIMNRYHDKLNIANIQIVLSDKQKRIINEKPLEFCILVYSKLFNHVEQMNKISIPFILLHHGRDKVNANKLGVYLDVLPYVYDCNENDISNEIKSILNKKQLYQTSFSELLFERLEDLNDCLPVINYGGIFDFDDITRGESYSVTNTSNSNLSLRASFAKDCLCMSMVFPKTKAHIDLKDIIMKQVDILMYNN